MKKAKLVPFDIAEELDSPAEIAEYLSQVLEGGDHDEFIRALGHVARARGMSKIAEDAGVGRESLYKALAKGAQPRYETIVKVTKALGVKLEVVAA